MANKIIYGSDFKLNINIEPIDGKTMDDYDFNIELYSNQIKVKTFTKKETKKVDANNRTIAIKSSYLNVGKLTVKVIAYIPDGDFEDNIRTEVIIIDTGIEIKRQ